MPLNANALAAAYHLAEAHPELEPLLVDLVHAYLPLEGPAESCEGAVLLAALNCYQAVVEADAGVQGGQAYREDVEFLRDRQLDVPDADDVEAWDAFLCELLPRL